MFTNVLSINKAICANNQNYSGLMGESGTLSVFFVCVFIFALGVLSVQGERGFKTDEDT